MHWILYLLFIFFQNTNAKVHNVLKTEVFAISLDPTMFNWTYEDKRGQYSYETSLADYPDLPFWIHYVFNERHDSGFLYGVPPSNGIEQITLDIVGLNKKTYETRVEKLDIIVQEKLNFALYEVHMKIDNLNVADLFDAEKMDTLKDVFVRNLWKNSEDDLYVTFLESAVRMGARKPLNPNEPEGVVIRLGSESNFSPELLQLQEEVRPLYKMQFCPRDIKRTSVERFFRDAKFVLDWCRFRLIEKDRNNSAMHKAGSIASDLTFSDALFKTFQRSEIPVRSYKNELIISIVLPMVIMMILVVALSLTICFVHEDLYDEESEFFFANIFHICTDWYKKRMAFSNQNSVMSTEPISDETLTTKSQTLRSILTENETFYTPHSPNSTLSRGMHCRPSPPPYVRPKFKPDM
ncbi:hypothetical protein ABEB36_006805 [Hypothenemus hampei]|uniref:Epsilon-sarcoglycan n=1 Tax=Hypothenemus hampei TaxID=57062 RepID=A0ABD1EUU9_HYPHA